MKRSNKLDFIRHAPTENDPAPEHKELLPVLWGGKPHWSLCFIARTDEYKDKEINSTMVDLMITTLMNSIHKGADMFCIVDSSGFLEDKNSVDHDTLTKC